MALGQVSLIVSVFPSYLYAVDVPYSPSFIYHRRYNAVVKYMTFRYAVN
jgi:hypothetical protein